MAEPLTDAQTAPQEHASLQEVRNTVAIPHPSAGFWKNWRAFVGPAILVSVGYMDPGNWATDLSAGARFKYAMLWVVALSSLMAIILQCIASRLGVVTGKDLAVCCREFYPRWTRWPNWLSAELAVAACDLAEALGSAVALKMLFGIPMLWGILITAADVLLLLALQRLGMRIIEAIILVLVATIAFCYFIELFILPHTKPTGADLLEMGRATITPNLIQPGMLYMAIAIIGATVMPHNLYMHSALVQTRKLQRDEPSIRQGIKFNAIDSIVALTIAFFVNAAIMVLAARVFYGKENLVFPAGSPLAGKPLGDDWIQGAFLTLAPLLGTTAASILFGVALLASGQSSTITGTLAGQVVMEGFMNWRIQPWLRRAITRFLAIAPAVIIIALYGESKTTDLINLSQVILGIQLPFAMIPLMHFTSSTKRMGKFRNPWYWLLLGWATTISITVLDVFGLLDMIFGWTGQ